MTEAQWKQASKVVLFLVGVGGIVFTLLTKGTASPVLLLILGMFAGLPIVLNVDGLIARVVIPEAPVVPPTATPTATPTKEVV